MEAMAAAMARAGFDLSQIGPRPSPAKGDTTYIGVIDQEGRGASLITSVFGDFGAHLGIPELGSPIGNRATMLRALRLPMRPGPRPPHTTIPAAVTRDGNLRMCSVWPVGSCSPGAGAGTHSHARAPAGAASGDRRATLPDRLRRGAVVGSGSPAVRVDARCRLTTARARRVSAPPKWSPSTPTANVTAGADPRRGGVAQF